MKILETIRVAFASLSANKLRSFLTILGIVVGIFSIISISTVISMLQSSIEEGVSGLNSNTFQIQKWPAVRTGGMAERQKIRNRPNITMEEYKQFKEVMTGAESIGAEQWRFGIRFSFNENKTNPNIQVCGGTTGAFPNNDWEIEKGRAFNENDIQFGNKVVVLGADIVKTLFEFVDPIGQEIKMNNYKLKVIGVLKSKGAVFGQSRDGFAIIPVSTFQSFYGKRGRSVNITVRAPEGKPYDDLIEQAIGHMRTIRKVEPGEDNDFDIRTNQATLESINEMTSSVRIGAIVIAAIALLAAGIGIMNIMLVSVTERTREIGIRKAVGAQKFNILLQFLVEAVVLCLFGGVVGIVFGISVGNILGSLMQASATIPLDWVAVGVGLCVFIGVLFGTYPAMKAANLDPIESLRYE